MATVVKFGGSSLASAGQIDKALAIVAADPERRYLVASAPGKRSADDVKVTDLLYRVAAGDRAALAAIGARYADIVAGLGVSFDLEAELAEVERHVGTGERADYFASRGEYLNSKIIAATLGWPFVDAAAVVRFDARGVFQAEATNALLAEALVGCERAVVPGFYGAAADGTVVTFSRGGSDVTGAIVARAVGAAVYENWTDVSGILMADPRLVAAPRPIAAMSYADLRALSFLGASVLHEAAVEPVRLAGIPLNIRNTNRPDDAGTWISAAAPADAGGPAVVGVAGRQGLAAVTVSRAMASGSAGGLQGLLAGFDLIDVAVTGVDTWAVVVADAPGLDGLGAVERGLALVGVVESGRVARGAVTARLTAALAGAGIDLRALSVGAGVQVAVVPEARYADAVRAVSAALVG